MASAALDAAQTACDRSSTRAAADRRPHPLSPYWSWPR